MARKTIAASVPDAGALAAGVSEDSTFRRVPLLVGMALACVLALAVPMLPAVTGSSSDLLSVRTGLHRHPPTRLSVGLAAAASSAIGSSERSFWPVRRGSALLTQGGDIHGTFTPSGAALRTANGTLGLSLDSIAHGGRLERVTAVAPVDAAGQVAYRHGSAIEFYRNGPYGLEQSFILEHDPHAGNGPLVLSLGLTGSLIPQQAGSQILFRSRAGTTALRYGQLRVVDATGRSLPAHMQIQNGTLELRIDDSNARYPLRIDPFIQQGKPLAGGGETGGANLGTSVALSSDGNTALIGGQLDNKSLGAVWVFTRSGSTWTQQGAKLTGKEETGEGAFGESVALSSNGNTALIGGYTDNKNTGAAWVFTRSGSTWTQQGAKLTGSGETGEGEFGWTAALSSDGNTAVIGGDLDNKNVGAAWVFTRSGSTWTQQGAKLTGSGETGEALFGYSVALSSDGNTALIGDESDNGFLGAAWVFTRSGSSWTQQGEKLTGSGEAGAGRFGDSVALSSDGNTALIGAPDDNSGAGAAWVFTRSGPTWTQQGAKLTGAEEVSGWFGRSVALSADGGTALIGGPTDFGAGGMVGAAWVFVNPPTVETKAASSITQTAAKLNGAVNPNGGEVGECKLEYGTEISYGASVPCTPSPASGNSPVAVSASLTGLRAGTTYHFRISATDSGGTSKGSDQTFETPQNAFIEQGSKLTGAGEVGSGSFGNSVAVSADGNTALVGGPNDGNGVGAAWVLTRSGSTWTQQKLTGSEEIGGASFGYSVALSADGNTALIGGYGDNAAWVFTRSGSTWTQQGKKLTGSEETGNPNFGYSVALSADGNTALIGGPHDNAGVGGYGAGAAWVFSRSGSTWTQQGKKLTGGGESGEGVFGYSVALSGDGDTALIGGWFDNIETRNGAAWVFTRSGSTWSQQGEKLTGTDGIAGSSFGWSVALSADGNTALIGGTDDNFELGAAWVFTRSGSTWTQQGEKLTPSGSSQEDFFGWSVALSGDGNTALIGGYRAENDDGAGAAWVFTRSGSAWTQQGETLSGSGESGAGEFGTSVALSSESPTALIGGPADSGGLGAVWAFSNNAPTVETKAASSLTPTSASLGATVNPDDSEVSGCHFEYGTSTAYGSTAPCVSLPGSGTSPVAVSASLTGLVPDTTYHYRISATNAHGTSDGEDETLETLLPPPTAEAAAASSITQTSARLSGAVNPNDQPISNCRFEYGPTSSYGSTMPCTPSPGSGGSPVAVSASLASLKANTTYHYRISAVNLSGTGESSDQVFATLGSPTVETQAATSVTPTSASLNATVNPNSTAVGDCHFEYGTSSSYGSSAPCISSPGSGNSSVPVSASLTGLRANTTYHFRISATNSRGTSTGTDRTFPNAESMGSKPGPVEISNPPGTQASSLSVEPVTQPGLPQHAVALVGALSYSVSDVPVGGSIYVTLNLPPGSNPTNVYKLEDGSYVNVTSLSTISRDTITVHLTDGGLGDGDGVANGVIVDPLVPVREPEGPTVLTEAPSSLTQTSATMNATVNPNGEEVGECELEYGPTTEYGSSAPCTPSAGSGTSAVAVSASLTGLTPNTTYHYRITATNPTASGTGSDETFETPPSPPTVVTGTASATSSDSATVNATVNSNGVEATECELEYGPSAEYGSSAPCTPSPGSGSGSITVAAHITGLSANTTYHFRISATNSGGQSKGEDKTFKTLTALCGPSNSPSDQGTTGVCNWYSTKAIIPAGQPKVIFLYGGFASTTNLVQASAVGEISCKTVGWGTIENPLSGGAGTGKIVGMGFYSCIAPRCENEVQEAFGTQGRATVTALNLPWKQALSEGGSPSSVRDQIGAPFSGSFGAPTAGEIDVKVSCEVIATKEQIETTSFEGALEPEIGVGPGPPPGLNVASELSFAGPSSGELESPIGASSYTGLLKYSGWAPGSPEVW